MKTGHKSSMDSPSKLHFNDRTTVLTYATKKLKIKMNIKILNKIYNKLFSHSKLEMHTLLESFLIFNLLLFTLNRAVNGK